MRTDLAMARLVRDPHSARGWLLLLDEHESSHVDLDDPTRLEFEYVRWLGDLVDVLAPPGAPLRVVHQGGGAATLARYVAATRGGSRQVVLEVDGALVDLVRGHLALRGVPGLRVRVRDAREGLAGLLPGGWDLVVRDAFTGTRVPAHLATLEHAAAVREVLGPDGCLVVNVADRQPLPAVRAEAATLLAVFDAVVAVTEPAVLRGRGHGNVLLAAAAGPLPVAAWASRVSRGAAPARLLDTAALRRLVAGVRPLHDGGPAVEPALPPDRPDGGRTVARGVTAGQ